jgi:hypothetical protein
VNRCVGTLTVVVVVVVGTGDRFVAVWCDALHAVKESAATKTVDRSTTV